MKYYTVKEVAKKLRISEGTIYEKIRNGEILKVANLGRVIRIPADEIKKFQNQYFDNFTYNKELVEVIETSLGKVRRIKSTNEYVARDVANAVGLIRSRNLTEKASLNNVRHLNIEEAKKYEIGNRAKGTNLINCDGVVEYSKRSPFNIDWDKFLKELKPSNENIQADECSQIEFEEAKTDNSNALSKIFEGTPVEIITDKNGEPLFELYSTGMALGQVVTAKGNIYPNKDRINKNIANADIQPVLRNAKPYLTEPMLYDFMFEAKTDKCKSFRKWVTNEVLPTIRKTGGYVNNAEKFTENYFSNLSEDTREIIKNELENKNKDLRLEKAKIEHELKSNTEMINLIDEA
ncbi:Prophage antirepressor [Clostridium neonatale]|uniref:helix-turn-helix domain-containing protein n=1 Tax=Clostridium neonatale TaxID=137838 RepID=UPI00291BED94|nr:helix-turn-helix domain-containing protein [Clostridium neonatale]CAI3586417.1 Prophage antirepressor [Clostridium neonatale]